MPQDTATPHARAGHPLARGARLVAAAVALLAAACGAAPPQLSTPVEALSASGESAPGASSSPSSTADEPVLAPALHVTLFDGTPFDLTEHLSRDGRPVVLQLWSSSCPACLQEMPHLDEAARRHPELLFLGVALQDDPVVAAEAAAELAVAYPVGADGDGAVAAAYPPEQLPAVFLIAGDGTLLGAAYGPLGPEAIEDLISRYLAG